MPQDKFSAVWVSHSSISDWLNCPRAYYLKNIYRDPKTRHKITLMSPPLQLGQAVHNVLEGLSVLAVDRRFSRPLADRLDQIWQSWFDPDTESGNKEHARQMLRRVETHPGPLKNLAVKIPLELPNYWLSEADGIILCGRIDWLEYLPENNAVHIIDFKTGKNEEKPDSLQLTIYCLLAQKTQPRPVAKLSYWYLDRDNRPQEQPRPDTKTAEARLLKIAKEIKLARQLNRFVCPHSGCRWCRPYEAIISGKVKPAGKDGRGNTVYLEGPPPVQDISQLQTSPF